MGYVTVKFLGEEYQVSETINEFLDYDKLLTPIRTKMLNTMTSSIKNSTRMTFGEHLTVYVRGKCDVCSELIDESAEVLVKKLLEVGIYDVTKNDLLNKIITKNEIENLGQATLRKILREGE